MAEPRGMLPPVAHDRFGLGGFARRPGKPEEAQEHLGTVAAMCREMGMRSWAERTEAERAGLWRGWLPE